MCIYIHIYFFINMLYTHARIGLLGGLLPRTVTVWHTKVAKSDMNGSDNIIFFI